MFAGLRKAVFVKVHPHSSFLYARNYLPVMFLLLPLLQSLQVYPQILGYIPLPNLHPLPLRTRHCVFVKAPSRVIIIYTKTGVDLCAGDSVGSVVYLSVGLTGSHEVGLCVTLSL